MASCSLKHKEINPDTGHGACSCPMWSGYGMPAGFCDKPAYGPQERGQRRHGNYIRGGWHAGYVPFLACHAHGGPKEEKR